MKFRKLIVATVSMFLLGWQAQAMEHVAYPIEEIKISDNYSDDENVVLKSVVAYPNGCYSTYEQLDFRLPGTKEIQLVSEVSIRPGVCTMAIVYDTIFFDLGEYKAGTYKIVDAVRDIPIARLVVDDEGEHKLREL